LNFRIFPEDLCDSILSISQIEFAECLFADEMEIKLRRKKIVNKCTVGRGQLVGEALKNIL
jgi:hypothetical protein